MFMCDDYFASPFIQENELYSGPGAYCYVNDTAKIQEWECAFIQCKSYEAKLTPGTKFLYCEYAKA